MIPHQYFRPITVAPMAEPEPWQPVAKRVAFTLAREVAAIVAVTGLCALIFVARFV